MNDPTKGESDYEIINRLEKERDQLRAELAAKEAERVALTGELEDETGEMPDDRPATNDEIVAVVHLLKQQRQYADECVCFAEAECARLREEITYVSQWLNSRANTADRFVKHREQEVKHALSHKRKLPPKASAMPVMASDMRRAANKLNAALAAQHQKEKP